MKQYFSNMAYQIDGEPGYYGVGTIGGAGKPGPSCHVWLASKANAPVDETTQDANNSEPFFDEETGEPRFIARCESIQMATHLTALLNTAPHLLETAPALLQMTKDLLYYANNAPTDSDADAARIYTLANADRLIAATEIGPEVETAPVEVKRDFRALALEARDALNDAAKRAEERKQRAHQKVREANEPAARALIEVALTELCGQTPEYEIEWTGEFSDVAAKVHLGDVTLAASFRVNQQHEPQDVTFSYNCYYFDNLAELGKLIADREAQDAYEAEECGG